MGRDRVETIGEPLVIWAFFTFAAWWLIGHPHYVCDFSVYWTAARHPGRAYDVGFISQLQAGLGPGPRPFAYPPTALFLMLPLGLLSLRDAFAVFVGLGTSLFFAAASALERRWRFLYVFSGVALINWNNGEATLVAAAALFAGVALLRPRPTLAGIAFAFALAIKPNIACAAPAALLLWRQWRTLASAGAVLTLIGGAATAVFGWSIWPAWLHAASDLPRIALPIHGVYGLSPAWGMRGPAAFIIRGLAAIFGLGALVFARQGTPVERATALGAAAVCWSPYILAYDAALFAPVAVGMSLSRSWRLMPGAALLLGLIAHWPLMAAFIVAAALGRVGPRLQVGQVLAHEGVK